MFLLNKFGLDKKGITQKDIDFIDVNLIKDNLLFLDPRLIENNTSRLCIEMRSVLSSYFTQIIKLIRKKDQIGLRRLCSGLSEPKETKLGYAQNGVDGNSIGNELIPDFIEAIKNNKAVASGIVYRFSDLELFVKNIGCDRISDITTKILKVNLILFTQSQCKKHGIPMSGILQTDLFDISDKSWKQKEVELPKHKGSPIIFVPKFTVRRKSDAGSSMGAFIRFAENEFVLKDPSEINDVPKNGRKSSVLKKDLRKKIRDRQGPNPQNGYRKIELSRWVSKYNSLLDDFNDFQSRNHKIAPLTDDEISAVIYS